MPAKLSQAWPYLLAFSIAMIMAGSGNLPSLKNRTVSNALPFDTETRLSSAVAPLVKAHPGASGIFPLPDAREAFAARVLLARAAERTLDVQYYIWQADTTGMLLIDALHDAAERGVRVRLLLDDNNTVGLDQYLAALDRHPNIEVRLFNPFVYREMRLLGYLTDFSRLNRRMHNKSFTADSQVTIIGGRNVGDEYFGASDDMLFSDLDVMAAGPAAVAVSQDFDRYWASQSSYPVDLLLTPASVDDVADVAASVRHISNTPQAKAYINAIRQSLFVQQLIERKLPLEWVKTRLVSDDPAKGLGLAKPQGTLFQRLKDTLETPSNSLYLVSPYFVPGEQGTKAFAAMAADSVKISILTNSLEATDVALVHSGYAKRRKPLLDAGIDLYESRRVPNAVKQESKSSVGSSYASLHAKTFSIDNQHVFIGSFNFDPRSANLNTEMGFILHSETLAGQIADAFKNRIPATAYQVELENKSELVWLEQRNEKTIKHTQEPGSSIWKRLSVKLFSFLPIDWLL